MENIVKGWFSTLLGMALMILAVYEWYEGGDWYKIGPPFISGVILLFMRDRMSEWVNDIILAVIEKIKK